MTSDRLDRRKTGFQQQPHSRPLLGAAFRLEDRLPQLSLPKLFIHGDRDDIIPIELGRQAFAAAKDPKEFYVVHGADHNDVPSIGGRAYFMRFSAFISAVLGR